MHYLIIMEWAEECAGATDILSVKHTMPEAIDTYREALETEKALAKDRGWEIIEDIPDCKFHATEKDYAAANFVKLYIQCVPD